METKILALLKILLTIYCILRLQVESRKFQLKDDARPPPRDYRPSKWLSNSALDVWYGNKSMVDILSREFTDMMNKIALRPDVLKDWLERPRCFLSFLLVQVMTGHGCFGSYLHRIGREESLTCWHCGAPDETAQHTLEVCFAWFELRRSMAAEIGPDLSLPGVVKAMLGNEKVKDIANKTQMKY